MEYIFFDIECANMLHGKAKICSFGYVLTDSSFNILEKKDILINPASFFDTYALKRMGTTLPYPKEEYEKAGKFPSHYEKIKGLLTKEGRIAIGHGTVNDAHFLLHECERYSLPPFDFKYSDTLKMYMKLTRREKKLDLTSVFTEIYPDENSLHSHRSDDDAEMTMKIAKNICEVTGRTLEDLIKNNNLLSEQVFSGRILDPECYLFRVNPSGCRKPDEIVKRCIELQSPAKNGVLNGANVALKARYQWLNLASYLKIIKLTNAAGGKFVEERWLADYVIQAGSMVKNNPEAKPKKISFSEFYTLTGSDEDRELSLVEMREIVGNFPENIEWYKKYKERFGSEYSATEIEEEKVFMCTIDLPVLKFIFSGEELDAEGKIAYVKKKLIYESMTDSFLPKQTTELKVKRDSTLSEDKFISLRESLEERVEEQKKILFPNQIDPNIKEQVFYNIFEYKVLATFREGRIEFFFRDTPLYEKKMHKVASSDEQIEEEIISTIRKYYTPEEFAKELRRMSKMKYGYRSNSIPQIKEEKRNYSEGMCVELAKNYKTYYGLKTVSKEKYPVLIDKNKNTKYTPVLMAFENRIFKEKIILPVVLAEQD
ncbi:MAG: 3'-5' exonuclease [Clostridiales bacterium]|nr:3'-5' exonuclease [Clostridiales bacterium]